MSKLATIFFSLVVVSIGWYFWASSSAVESDQLAQIKYYANSPPTLSRPTDTLTVMTYNIGYLSGNSNNLPVRESVNFYRSNLQRVARLLNRVQPDIVGYQEIDFASSRSYYMNQLDSLAKYTSLHFAALTVNWDKRYVPFPYWPPAVHFGRVLSGQAVQSRFPVISNERMVLPRPQNNAFYYDAFYLERLAQVAEIDVGRPLIIINVHLEAYDTATRERQAQKVLRLAQKYVETYPVLLIGDFNSPLPNSKLGNKSPASNEHRWQDDESMHILLSESKLAEAFANELANGEEIFSYTFSSFEPHVKIDHIFYNTNKIQPLDWFVVHDSTQASDHLPVVMRFRFLD